MFTLLSIPFNVPLLCANIRAANRSQLFYSRSSFISNNDSSSETFVPVNRRNDEKVLSSVKVRRVDGAQSQVQCKSVRVTWPAGTYYLQIVSLILVERNNFFCLQG